MQVRVTEKEFPTVSSKLIQKRLEPLENMGDLRVNGILGDGNVLLISLLPWCGSGKTQYGYQGRRGPQTSLLSSCCSEKCGKGLGFSYSPGVGGGGQLTDTHKILLAKTRKNSFQTCVHSCPLTVTLAKQVTWQTPSWEQSGGGHRDILCLFSGRNWTMKRNEFREDEELELLVQFTIAGK